MRKRRNNNSVKSGDSTFDEARKGTRIDKNLTYRILLISALILGITFLYPMEKIYQPLDVPGLREVATEDIRAPFDFQIYKNQEELERDREIVTANLRPALILDTLISQMIINRVQNFFIIVDSIKAGNIEWDQVVSLIRNSYPYLSDSVIVSLFDDSPNIKSTVVNIIDSLVTAGVVNDVNSLHLQSNFHYSLKYKIINDLIFILDTIKQK